MMMSNLQFCFLTEVLVVVLLYNDLDHNNMADVSWRYNTTFYAFVETLIFCVDG